METLPWNRPACAQPPETPPHPAPVPGGLTGAPGHSRGRGNGEEAQRERFGATVKGSERHGTGSLIRCLLSSSGKFLKRG